MDKVHIGVVGSRHYTDYNSFVFNLSDYTDGYGDVFKVILVSGGAKGADAMAEHYAKDYLKDSIIVYAPDPALIKQRGFTFAAHDRNQKIVDRSDLIVAFVAEGSKGTWDTIKRAIKAKRHVIIIPV